MSFTFLVQLVDMLTTGTTGQFLVAFELQAVLYWISPDKGTEYIDSYRLHSAQEIYRRVMSCRRGRTRKNAPLRVPCEDLFHLHWPTCVKYAETGDLAMSQQAWPE